MNLCKKGLELSTLHLIRMQNVVFSTKSLPILTMFTKDECSLCEDAKDSLKKFEKKVILEEVDITEEKNKDWYKQYRYEIPVFHLNGKFLMKHRVNEDLLQQKLKELWVEN